MADDQTTLDGEKRPNDNLIGLWADLTDLLDVSQQRAQELVPEDADSDRVRGLRYVMDDAPGLFYREIDGETILTTDADPLTVHYLLSEEAVGKEAMRLAHFGPGAKNTPLAVLRESAPPGSWGDAHDPDPTQIGSVDCGGCGETFYDVVVPRLDEDRAGKRPWDVSVPSERMWVNSDGRRDPEAWIADDEAAEPYYVREDGDDDAYLVCDYCRDSLYDYGRFLTVFFDGDTDQAQYDDGIVLRSYIRDMTDNDWLFWNDWGRELRDSAVLDSKQPKTDLHGEFVEKTGLPGELVRALHEREVRPYYPILFDTHNPTPEPSGKWLRCWVPGTNADEFDTLIKQYREDD